MSKEEELQFALTLRLLAKAIHRLQSLGARRQADELLEEARQTIGVEIQINGRSDHKEQLKAFGLAILDDELRILPCEDYIKWARWYEGSKEKRRVARDVICGFVVSTVFLAIDHSHGFGPKPLWFETMVFRADSNEEMIATLDYEQARYTTWQEASEGHKRICELVRRGEIGE